MRLLEDVLQVLAQRVRDRLVLLVELDALLARVRLDVRRDLLGLGDTHLVPITEGAAQRLDGRLRLRGRQVAEQDDVSALLDEGGAREGRRGERETRLHLGDEALRELGLLLAQSARSVAVMRMTGARLRTRSPSWRRRARHGARPCARGDRPSRHRGSGASSSRGGAPCASCRTPCRARTRPGRRRAS